MHPRNAPPFPCVLACALVAACTAPNEAAPSAVTARFTAALSGAVGSNHPASGQWAPVNEAGWATATWALGARYVAGEGSDLEVAVYSPNATKVVLEIYGQATGADALFDYGMQKGADGVWRAAVQSASPKTMYAFRAWGPNWPFASNWDRGNSSAGFQLDCDPSGNRFNPNKVLFDPYARELTHDVDGAALAAAGENGGMFGTGGAEFDAGEVYSGPITGGVTTNRRNVDTGRYVPKSIALVDASSYGTKPSFAPQDERVYEAHVKGLTAHPSSVNLKTLLTGFAFPHAQSVPDAYRGTYAGAGYLAGYLKDLGYTAVELLPIHETDNDTNSTTRAGGNYWGYDTYNFFSPDRHYAFDKTPGGPTREFKAMVKAFHDAGLEVWLDVVYNHTGEGQTWETKEATKLLSMRGFANADYYLLSGTYWYFDSTCCGDFNASSAVGRTLIVDSLNYWANQMGVDGFRFDLAVVLGLENYAYTSNSQALKAIVGAAQTNGYKVVAEPWDAQGHVQIGNFPAGWAQWNGYYRDTIRSYMKGSLSGAGGIGYADAFYGDYGQFDGEGGPQLTVNMIDAHDGFGLVDLVSYDTKTNSSRAWPFGPSDGGSDDNRSSSWGGNQVVRRQVIRNFELFQILSRGLPMQVWGDELGRTQNGNNNPYSVDSVATWNNYDMVASASPDAVATGDTTGGTETYHNDLGTFAGGRNQNFAFLQYLLRLRNDHPAFRQASYAMPITFTRADGSGGFDQYGDAMMRAYIGGSSVGDSDFVLFTNVAGYAGTFAIPAPPAGKVWVRLVDTQSFFESVGNAWQPCSAAVVSGTYGVANQSSVLLQAIPSGACSCTTVPVTFTIANAGTSYGQSVYVSGNTAALGNWSSNGFALAVQGPSGNSPWTGTANLPPNTVVQYKYVKYTPSSGASSWEHDQTYSQNRQLTTGACGTTTVAMDGGFRFD